MNVVFKNTEVTEEDLSSLNENKTH